MNHDVTAKNVHNLLLIPFGVIATISAEIWLTLAFKEEFWKLSLQGYTGTAAFRKLGYNTEVIGFERIHNTTKRIRRDAQSIGGLHEGNSGGVYINRSRKSKTDSAESQAEEATKRMQKEIVCFQQQMAFLKKL